MRYITAGVIGLAIAVSVSWILPRMDDIRFSALYVGEGQSLILQSSGETILIDCGGNSDSGAADTASETLLSQGIFHIDHAVLTHYDRDHAGALENFLTRIRADNLYLPAFQKNTQLFEEKLFGQNIQIIEYDMSFPLGEGMITLYAPGTLKTENENCMCVLFESPKCVILITGDRSRSGEKRLLKAADLPDVDVLVAGHHGSKNSTSTELLEAVSPEIVVISAGINNSYNHPAPELLERLDTYGCTVYRTDQSGTILIRR